MDLKIAGILGPSSLRKKAWQEASRENGTPRYGSSRLRQFCALSAFVLNLKFSNFSFDSSYFRFDSSCFRLCNSSVRICLFGFFLFFLQLNLRGQSLFPLALQLTIFDNNFLLLVVYFGSENVVIRLGRSRIPARTFSTHRDDVRTPDDPL